MSVSGVLCLLACLIQTVDLTLGLGPNQVMDFTFLLPAGGTECFFQPTSRNKTIEVEYQVKFFFFFFNSNVFGVTQWLSWIMSN